MSSFINDPQLQTFFAQLETDMVEIAERIIMGDGERLQEYWESKLSEVFPFVVGMSDCSEFLTEESKYKIVAEVVKGFVADFSEANAEANVSSLATFRQELGAVVSERLETNIMHPDMLFMREAVATYSERLRLRMVEAQKTAVNELAQHLFVKMTSF